MVLSIIIVNYHSLELIESCLKSIKKYPPNISFEIVIVNNDSNKEKFLNFKKKHKELTCIQNSGNWGFSSGCNLGAKSSSGKYLLFLNPDTEINESMAIDKMIAAMESIENIGICGCKILDSNKQEENFFWNSPWFFIKTLKQIHFLLFKRFIDKQFSKDLRKWDVEMVSGAALCISSIDFNTLSGFKDDVYWMYSEDRDLCFRMIKKLRKRIVKIRDCEIFHSWGGASISSDSLIMEVELLISRHNFIIENTSGLSKLLLLLMYVFKNVFITFFKLALNHVFLKKEKIEKYRKNLQEILSYYQHCVKNRTWKSKRIKNEKR